MYPDLFHVKEVNAYYARMGDIRATNVKGYANVRGFSDYIRKATLQRNAAAQAAQSVQGSRTARSASAQETATQADAARPTVESGENICCEKCLATNQLALQMLSRNLYAQNGLGYPAIGSAGWTAYQNMANMLGSNLFS